MKFPKYGKKTLNSRFTFKIVIIRSLKHSMIRLKLQAEALWLQKQANFCSNLIFKYQIYVISDFEWTEL